MVLQSHIWVKRVIEGYLGLNGGITREYRGRVGSMLLVFIVIKDTGGL